MPRRIVPSDAYGHRGPVVCGAVATSGSPPITLVCLLRHGHRGRHRAVNARKVYRW